jgi:hypothetical protein
MAVRRLSIPAAGLIAFIVYVYTLAPTITWRNDGVDSGDLATAVAVGGVPHPPGYPTYLILGEVFKRLPIGDIAYRLNLLSAFSAALAVVLLGLLVDQTLVTASQRRTESAGDPSRDRNLRKYASISAALTLAFSSPFWSQAVIGEVYALHALFAAALVYGPRRVVPANASWLVPLLCGLFGLSLGNHVSIVLLLPMLVWWLRPHWHWRLAPAAILALGLGLSSYLIIPLRAAHSPPVNWGGATSWANFGWLVRADIYRPFLFGLPWEYVPARIVATLKALAEAFEWWGVPVGLIGLHTLMKYDRWLAFCSLGTALLFAIYAIGYNTTDSYVYLLPAWLIYALWVGWGLYAVGTELQRHLGTGFQNRHLLGLAFVLLPLLWLGLNISRQNISHDGEALAYAKRSLQLVAPDAIIVADNDLHTFALWYGRYALTVRPDVTVVNSNLLPLAWYQENLRRTHPRLRLTDQTDLSAFIEQNLATSPIYLATLEAPSLTGYVLEPAGPLHRVLATAQ